MSVNGPFVTIQRSPSSGYPMVYDRWDRYHSGLPRVPLPYTRVHHTASDFWSETMLDAHATGPLQGMNAHLAVCYDKVWGKANDIAGNLINLAQMNQAMGMLGNRTLQAAEIFRAIRRKDLRAGLLALRVRDPDGFDKKKRRTTAKQGGDLWLELQFGWKPIMQDISKSIDILEREFGTERTYGVHESSSLIDKPYGMSRGQEDSREYGSCHLKVSASARVVPTNPNLLLANQLGFTNPALLAWDLIPFSFVVDWFIPVAKYAASYTNDYGCELREPCTSWGLKADMIREVWYRHWNDSFELKSQNTATRFMYSRSASFPPRPGLFDRFRIPDPTVWHAITSGSLLMQQLAYFK